MSYRAQWKSKAETDGDFAIACALTDLAYAVRALGDNEGFAVRISEGLSRLNDSLIEAATLLGAAVENLKSDD